MKNKMQNKIPIVFCFDTRIILGASVAVKSLLEYAAEDTCYDIRIFHSEIKQKDQDSLKLLVGESRHSIKFHYIAPKTFAGAPCSRGSWSEIVYYRLLIPEVLPEYDKVIYSDVDVLFQSDLSELYNMDMDGYEAAAVSSYTTDFLKRTASRRYFSENKNTKNYMSGLLLFNSKLMREEKTVDKFFETIKAFGSRLVYFDMDVFNLTCTRIKDIPMAYCVLESVYEYTDIKKISEYAALSDMYSDEYLLDLKNHAKIIHYAGKLGKPWQRKWIPEYYREYIEKLPPELVRYTFRDIRKRFLSGKKYPQQHFDVGIVNFYHSQNYGACLTAYALQEIVKGLGYSCAFVNEFRLKKRNVTSFGRLFVNRYLKLMPKFHSMKKVSGMADIFITGSDQVFRPSYMKRKGKRDKYLLAFVKNAKKIAFSASFGIDIEKFQQTNLRIRKDYKKLLSDFDYISCREDSGVDICRQEFNLKAEWIIDPVFVLEKDKFTILAKKSQKNYTGKIVSYILDKNPTYDILHKELSEKYEMELENLASKENSVEDWLRAFADAEYIVTDSFHGVCFALIFNKPFMAVVNKKRGTARFDTLQKMFDLNEQFLSDLENVDIAQQKFVDYDIEKINNIIADRKIYALQVLKNELGSRKTDFITKDCTGCGACYNICPRGAIEMKENHEGFLYPSVNAKLCTNCKLCAKICPVNQKQKKNNFSAPECYAVMASDEIRMSGVSSGGASHILLEKFLHDGGFIAGAVYDDELRIEHIVTGSDSDLEKIKGSKYFQSNTGTVYAKIKDLLKDSKKVLFAGTPCQVAGLKNFIGAENENLLTVDIVCHGVPSYKLFRMFIEGLNFNIRDISDVNFRDKKNGWNSNLIFSFTADGKKYFHNAKSTTFMASFLYDYTMRKSCFVCPFQKTPRQGDITIGDFWRIQRYKKSLDDSMGTSLLLVNNQKGLDFFASLKDKFKIVEKVPFKYAVKGNKNLIRSTKLNKNRDYFMANVTKENIDSLLRKFIGAKYKG